MLGWEERRKRCRFLEIYLCILEGEKNVCIEVVQVHWVRCQCIPNSGAFLIWVVPQSSSNLGMRWIFDWKWILRVWSWVPVCILHDCCGTCPRTCTCLAGSTCIPFYNFCSFSTIWLALLKLIVCIINSAPEKLAGSLFYRLTSYNSNS